MPETCILIAACNCDILILIRFEGIVSFEFLMNLFQAFIDVVQHRMIVLVQVSSAN